MTTASRSAKRKPARKKKSSSAARPADPNPAPARKTPDDGPAAHAGGGGSFVQSVRDGSAFGAVARWSCGHAWFVVLAFLALAIGGATLAATKLKVDTDPNLMISADLDFKQSFKRFNETFPAVDANFVFVVDSEDPEQAKDAAFRLAEKLRSQPSLFAHVLAPGTGKFFEDYGILYAKPEEVEKLVSGIVQAGPMLKGLADQPNLAGLSGLLNEVTAYTQAGRAPDGFAGFLNNAAATVEAETAGSPRPMDWTAISDDDPKLTDTRWFVLTKPILDFTQLEAAAAPMSAARALLEDPEITGNGVATVRLTGEAAMDAEEFEAVTKGAITAGIVSFIIVSITIFLGLPSLRLIIPAMALIILGFLINAGFATVSIGYLNMISVAFAVLFIGLGVDYAVHVVLRYAEERARGLSRTDAAEAAVTKMGPALGLCTLTTALAFLAFVPTSFVGMAQLGIIASGGMVIAFVASITLIPAMLKLIPDNHAKIERKLAHKVANETVPGNNSSHVRMLATVLVITIAGIALATFPQARFDGDPVNLKDPDAPSVKAFLEVASEEAGVHYTAEYLTDAGPKAREMAEKFRALPIVEKVVMVEEFLPAGQEAKLAELGKLTNLVPRSVNTESDIGAPARSRMLEIISNNMTALVGTGDAPEDLKAAAARMKSAIEAFRNNRGSDDEAVKGLENSLFSGLPALMGDINRLATTAKVTIESLDETIRERYVASDGRWRLEISPRADMRDEGKLYEFVDAVKSVSDDAMGPAINVAGSARAVAQSMIMATLAALVLVVLIVWPALRNVRDVALVLAPLLLASTLMVGYTVVFDAPFNFANVIVLPLLLGLGVDSSIHYVMRAREGDNGTDVTGTSTPRAVLISAMTTIGSFGTLWLSAHRGMASMGELLTIAILVTLVCTLVVLPQLIEWAYSKRASGQSAHPAD
ncbi:MAG: MMPL family transporter [Anderseniella sp.]|nr:MMPL family transporter [Anderseniella sp.]